MTAVRDSDHHRSEPEVLRSQDVYLPAAVAAYRSRPRGPEQVRFDPGSMRPRWRHAVIAFAVLVLVVAASLAVPVHFGPSGTIISIDGSLVAVATSPDHVLGWDAEVTLRVGDERLPATVLTEERVEEGQFPVQVTVLTIEEGAVLSDEAVGSPAMLELGTRPFLVDLIRKGRP